MEVVSRPVYSKKHGYELPAMEANLVRILLLIALFFLLSSDYSSVVKQLIPTFDEAEEDSDNSEVDITPPRLRVEKVEENTLKAEENESKCIPYYLDRRFSESLTILSLREHIRITL